MERDKMTKRIATLQDAKKIYKCFQSANNIFSGNPQTAATEDDIIELLKTATFMVYELDDVIIAWIAFRYIEEIIVIEGLYVNINYQRKGFASRLLNDILSNYTGEKIHYCCLSSLKSAPWSNCFYEAHSFINYEKKKPSNTVVQIYFDNLCDHKWENHYYRKLRG